MCNVLKEKCQALIKRWNAEIKDFEIRYRFGRCGNDDGSMTHGRYEQLESCTEDLELILKE